jgi:hypothetical protein
MDKEFMVFNFLRYRFQDAWLKENIFDLDAGIDKVLEEYSKVNEEYSKLGEEIDLKTLVRKFLRYRSFTSKVREYGFNCFLCSSMSDVDFAIALTDGTYLPYFIELCKRGSTLEESKQLFLKEIWDWAREQGGIFEGFENGYYKYTTTLRYFMITFVDTRGFGKRYSETD